MKILIVDDQQAVRLALQVLFEINEIPCLMASRPDEVLEIIAAEDVGVVIQDMNFTTDDTSGNEGSELFKAIRKLDPDMPVLLMTAWTSLETAVRLVKEGAADYFEKPWDDEKILSAVRNLLRMREVEQENARLRGRSRRARSALAGRYDLRGLVYASDAMHAVVSLAVNVAASDAPVLITGPNGSGKEKLAEIIQANSRRRERPFIKVNAGGLPDELLEAELFGAEAGAYTGATRQRIGRFESADGGTLFLDEIGNLSSAGQMKLLRVLQTGEFERLGSNSTRKVDARIVSATNADLPRAIAAGTFREDLYFRLNVIELHVPPLAERPEDILPLAEHYLAGRTLTSDARQALLAHEWPGNVRELQNKLQRATLVSSGTAPLRAEDLGFGVGGQSAGTSSRPLAAVPAALNATPSAGTPSGSHRIALAPEGSAGEREAIEEALHKMKGVVAKAAAELGMSRQALYRRMERLGIVMERRPR